MFFPRAWCALTAHASSAPAAATATATATAATAATGAATLLQQHCGEQGRAAFLRSSPSAVTKTLFPQVSPSAGDRLRRPDPHIMRLPAAAARGLSGLSAAAATAAARATHVSTAAASPAATAAAATTAAAGSQVTQASALPAATAALPRGAQLTRAFRGHVRCFNSSSSSSSRRSSSSSSSRQQPVGRRIRSRSYDPPLASDFAEADRLERMPRSSQTTGGWNVSWSPFKPSAATTSAAAAGGGEKSSREAAAASLNAPSVGYSVPYRFRVEDNCIAEEKKAQRLHPLNRPSSSFLTYTDFAGNRLPILDTSENVRYWRDEGLDRLLPRVFPLRLPAHRRVDPLLRELIFCLFQIDPRRFGVSDLAMRYGLRETTVRKIIREFTAVLCLFCCCCSRAPPQRRRHMTTAAILLRRFGAAAAQQQRGGGQTLRGLKGAAKETLKSVKGGWLLPPPVESAEQRPYPPAAAATATAAAAAAARTGYEQMGTEEIDSQEETKFEGWKSTFDWVLRQHIEVETMSAFPLPGKRKGTYAVHPSTSNSSNSSSSSRSSSSSSSNSSISSSSSSSSSTFCRVDVDLTVKNTKDLKVISWVDPNEKVVF
ncbi:hypothetical protein Emed_002580 [Eimeria media]